MKYVLIFGAERYITQNMSKTCLSYVKIMWYALARVILTGLFFWVCSVERGENAFDDMTSSEACSVHEG